MAETSSGKILKEGPVLDFAIIPKVSGSNVHSLIGLRQVGGDAFGGQLATSNTLGGASPSISIAG